MTPGTDDCAEQSRPEHMEAGDWDVMFRAVLARLGSVIEALEPQAALKADLVECAHALEQLRELAQRSPASSNAIPAMKA